MDNNINKYENDIKKLCVHMICLLDKLKEMGLIDDEEYKKHVFEKKKFLDSIHE